MQVQSPSERWGTPADVGQAGSQQMGQGRTAAGGETQPQPLARKDVALCEVSMCYNKNDWTHAGQPGKQPERAGQLGSWQGMKCCSPGG